MFIFLITILIVFTIYLIFPYILIKIIRKEFLRKSLENGCVSLTFDDGPHPYATPEIVKLLKKANVKATFFVLGENAEKYPGIIDELVSNGHDIEEHSHRHLHPWKSDPIRYIIDLIRSDSVITKFNKRKTTVFFRPPFGKVNLVTLLYIMLKRRKVAFWNIDPKDYNQNSGVEVANFVLDNIEPGSIILLHDGRVNQNGSDVEVTILALKIILESLKNSAFRITTIKESVSADLSN